jgi:HK97 gp10 family phage protein
MDRLEKELAELVKKLDAVKFLFDDSKFEKILAEAAVPAQDAVKAEAPQSKKSHLMADGGGSYKRVKPGNLKRSVQIFKARGHKNRSVLVGPIVSKKSRVKSVEGAKRVSRAKRAFYWKFMHYGTARIPATRFMDKARSRAAGAVMLKLKAGIKKYARKEVQKIFE